MGKRTKKLKSGMIGMLLAVAMVMTNFAGLGPEPQKAKAATMQGTGESSDPYQISNYAQLKEFADIVNGTNGQVRNRNACAILTNDIICTDELWVPIADYNTNTNTTNKYNGTFDGKGYKIIGLSNNEIPNVENLRYQGLFGYVGNNGVVTNVKLEEGSITGNYDVGGVAGENAGSISNCYNTGAVSGAYDVGGVAGDNSGSITNSYNIGVVSGQDYVGGVAGYIGSNGSISNCYNTGAISGANYHIGGVAGYIGSNGSISNCYNTGAVTGNIWVGGVAGYNSGSISKSYNAGSVTGNSNVGGVVGDNDSGNIENCDEKTLNELTGSGALSSMGFDTSVWMIKADKECDGRNYWFYPHLKGFEKDENGVQIDPENIPADIWPAKVEICADFSGNDTYTYDKSFHAVTVTNVISNKPIIPDGKTAKYSVLSGTSYTGEYAVMPTEPGSYRVSIYDSETASTPSEVKYFKILSAVEDYTVPYKYMTGTDTNGEPVWENRTVSETVNAGTYRAVIDFGTGHSSLEKQFTITPVPATVTPNNVSKEFGSSDPELTYTVEGLLGGDSLAGSLSRIAGENVAEYNITLGTLSNPNYDITFVTGRKLTITPKALGSEAIRLSAEESEYNGTARTPNVTVYDGETVVPASEYSVNITGNVNAGTATVEVSDVADGNYSVSGAKTFTIKEATVTVTGITAKDKAYDGNDTAELDFNNVTITGVLDADRDKVSVTATGKFENANAGKNKRVIVSNIQLTGTAAANYCLSDTGNQTEATAEIFKLDSRINEIPLAKSGLVYTGNKQELITEGATENGTLVYALTEKGAVAPDDNMYSTDIPAATDAGTYTVYYKVTGDANYNDVPVVKVDVEIKRASQDIPDVSAVDETVSGKKDGQITGLSDKMEISTDLTSAEFKAVEDISGTGYAPGTYYIRYSSDANHNVSDTKTVTIKAGRKLAVTFVSEGKTYESISVDYGTKVQVPDVPTRDGFKFNGWLIDETKDSTFDFETNITEDTTLYAAWEKEPAPEPTPEPQPQPIIIPSNDDYTPEPVEPTITPGVETTTVKNSDGSVTTTTKTTHKDGSVTLKTVTERKDGGSDTEEVIRDKDGKVVSTMKETVRYNKYDTKTVVTTVNKANGYSSKTVEKTYTSGTVSKETTEITPNKTVKYIKEVKKKSGKVTVESVETNAKGKTSLSSSVKSADKSQIVKVYSVKKNGAVRLEYVETGKKVIKVPDTVTFNGVTYAVDTVTTGAFAGDNTVTSIKLGSNIRYIQEGAFLGAENLQKITVNATSLKKVYEGAFDDVRSDVVIYIEAPTKKSFNKAKKKLLNAGLPTTAKVVWTKIIPAM